MITFNTSDVAYSIKKKRNIAKWIRTVIANEEKKAKDIAIIFCSDNYLNELNNRYLNHNSLTDIITFEYSENNKEISGDLYISIERVKENAEKLQVKFENEILRVIIHGVLHLLGYNDKTKKQKEEIRRKEDECLIIFPG